MPPRALEASLIMLKLWGGRVPIEVKVEGMSLFTTEADRKLPLLTQVYQVDASNRAEVECFFVRDLDFQPLFKPDPTQIDCLAELCRFVQGVMSDLGEGRGLSPQQVEEINRLNEVNRRTLVGTPGPDRLQAADLAWRIRVPAEYDLNPYMVERIAVHLTQLLQEYIRGNALLKKCGECGSWFLSTERFQKRLQCSRRCQKRAPNRETYRRRVNYKEKSSTRT